MRKITAPAHQGSRHYRGFNLLAADDQELFRTLARGEHHISGFTNRSLRNVLRHKSSSQISRLLKRLRTHGLIKKVGRTYKYYLTKLGQAAVIAATKLREILLVPTFSQTAVA
jgi:predicted transcriptional regulator